MAIVAGVPLEQCCLGQLDGQAAVASIRGRLPDELTVGVPISSRVIPFSVLGSQETSVVYFVTITMRLILKKKKV